MVWGGVEGWYGEGRRDNMGRGGGMVWGEVEGWYGEGRRDVWEGEEGGMGRGGTYKMFSMYQITDVA